MPRRYAPSVVLVAPAEGGLLGGFVTSPWRPAAAYYGTSEGFVFTLGEECRGSVLVRAILRPGAACRTATSR